MVPVLAGPIGGELVQRQGLSLVVTQLRCDRGELYEDGKLPAQVAGRHTTFIYRLLAIRLHRMAAPFDVYVPRDQRDPSIIRALYGEFFTGGHELVIDPDDARWPSNRPWG